MTLETTEDRSTIPKLDSDLINAGQMQLAKISAPLVTAVVAILAGVLPNTGLGTIPKLADIDRNQQGLVILGILLVVGMSILGLSLVWSADLKARAEASAANLALRALPAIVTVAAPPGAPGQGAGLWVTLKRTGSDDEYLVIGARKLEGSKTEFLIARGNDVPQWVQQADVEDYLVKPAGPAK